MRSCRMPSGRRRPVVRRAAVHLVRPDTLPPRVPRGRQVRVSRHRGRGAACWECGGLAAAPAAPALIVVLVLAIPESRLSGNPGYGSMPAALPQFTTRSRPTIPGRSLSMCRSAPMAGSRCPGRERRSLPKRKSWPPTMAIRAAWHTCRGFRFPDEEDRPAPVLCRPAARPADPRLRGDAGETAQVADRLLPGGGTPGGVWAGCWMAARPPCQRVQPARRHRLPEGYRFPVGLPGGRGPGLPGWRPHATLKQPGRPGVQAGQGRRGPARLPQMARTWPPGPDRCQVRERGAHRAAG